MRSPFGSKILATRSSMAGNVVRRTWHVLRLTPHVFSRFEVRGFGSSLSSAVERDDHGNRFARVPRPGGVLPKGLLVPERALKQRNEQVQGGNLGISNRINPDSFTCVAPLQGAEDMWGTWLPRVSLAAQPCADVVYPLRGCLPVAVWPTCVLEQQSTLVSSVCPGRATQP